MATKTVDELQEIATQLACPRGGAGIKTDELMSAANSGMTLTCIDSMEVSPHNRLLEIEPGNASHLPYLLARATDLFY